jgi:adenylate kinase family enzyme
MCAAPLRRRKRREPDARKIAEPCGLPHIEVDSLLWQPEADQTWLPRLRSHCREAEERGTKVIRLESVKEVAAFAATLDHPLAPK